MPPTEEQMDRIGAMMAEDVADEADAAERAALERDAHGIRLAVRHAGPAGPAAAPAFERPQLERGSLGAPVRLATNFTTLNIRAGQEVFKCEAACPNPMCQRLQPDLHQRLQP